MFRTRPAHLALLGSFILGAAGCASDSCGERPGWFSRFRHTSAPATACPCEGIPCCGPEFPGLPPGAVNGTPFPFPGQVPGPGPGPGLGPAPGQFMPPAGVTTPGGQPGEAQPYPYTPSGGRAGLPARTTGKS